MHPISPTISAPPMGGVPKVNARNRPSKSGGAEASPIESWPDARLAESIEALRKADYLGSWGRARLEVYEAEAQRRGVNRRGKELLP